MRARPVGSGTAGVSSALALIAIAVLVSTASAAADPTPTTGPTAGGTSISGEVPTIGFTQVATSTVSGGSAATYALGTDGEVYAWGSNAAGQLGTGTAGGSALAPQRVVLPAEALPVTEIAAGFIGGYALGADGNVYAWGDNNFGQAGNGTSGATPISPVMVNLPPAALPAAQIAGYVGGAVLGADGKVYTWGQNTNGQIGNGTTGSPVLTPVAANLPPAALPVTRITTDSNTVYAIGADGAVYAWGDNSSRQLGNGAAGPSNPTPTKVSLPSAALPAADVLGSTLGASVIGADGNVYSWGGNNSGQVGNGTVSANVPTPVVVSLPASAVPVEQIGGVGITGYAVGADGGLYAWGSNGNGQFGNGTTTSQSSPTLVTLPSAVTSIARITGAYTAYLLDDDDALFAWGLNTNGQVGNGTSGANVTAPVPVPLAAITSVTIGGIAVSGLTQTSTRSEGGPVIAWTATTPAGCGPEDIVVSWTQAGESLEQTFPGGFVFGAAPSFTSEPASASIAQGGSFTASVSVAGDSEPNVQWQQEGPAGTWSDLAGETGTTLTVDGLMATTTFRAIATNCWGADAAAVSQAATATVRQPRTVEFDANGGIGAMAPQTADTPTALAPNAFTRSGFTFAGWNTVAGGSGTAYADGAVFGFTADATLFAQWTAVPPGPTPPLSGGDDMTATGGPDMLPLLGSALVAILAGAAVVLATVRRRRAR